MVDVKSCSDSSSILSIEQWYYEWYGRGRAIVIRNGTIVRAQLCHLLLGDKCVHLWSGVARINIWKKMQRLIWVSREINRVYLFKLNGKISGIIEMTILLIYWLINLSLCISSIDNRGLRSILSLPCLQFHYSLDCEDYSESHTDDLWLSIDYFHSLPFPTHWW